MRKVIYGFNVSLDGFIEDAAGNFDWSVPDPELHRYFNEREREIGTHLYGRRLWETMKVWQTLDQDPSAEPELVEFAKAWRDSEVIVFSRTLESVEGNARLERGGPAALVRKLKEGDGKEIEVGGAQLASTLIKLGLV